jgi:hypothetical protein
MYAHSEERSIWVPLCARGFAGASSLSLPLPLNITRSRGISIWVPLCARGVAGASSLSLPLLNIARRLGF